MCMLVREDDGSRPCVALVPPPDFISLLSAPQFNTPLQLRPAPSTGMVQMITLPVCTDDILVLGSDGLNDNLWDEDLLDRVIRFWHTFLASNVTSGSQLPRRALLSEVLCLRACRVLQCCFKTTSAAETFEMILKRRR